MFTFITLSGAPDPTLIANHSSGVQIKGVTSGATGLVYSQEYVSGAGLSGDAGKTRITLTNVVGTFVKGEKIAQNRNMSLQPNGYMTTLFFCRKTSGKIKALKKLAPQSIGLTLSRTTRSTLFRKN